MFVKNRLVIILFTLGLVLRVATIPVLGSYDLVQFSGWGQQTYEHGLSQSFQGVYFPVQYYLFSASYAIGQYIDVSTDKIIKIFNLVFELGLLGLLVFLTRKYLPPWKVLVLYWLNPFTFGLFLFGFVDFQFSFFILLAVVALLNLKERKYIIAGVPLGIALLMKPQVVPLFVGICTLLPLCWYMAWKRGEKGPKEILGIFVAPAVFLALFSLYFGLTLDLNGHKTLTKISNVIHTEIKLPENISEHIAESTFLVLHYIHVPDDDPSINANMPNAWFFVASALNPDNKPIYRISDSNELFGITYRMIGLFILLTIQTILIFKICSTRRRLSEKILFVLCIAPILVPYLATSAHSNHFYFGFIGTILLGAFLRDTFILRAGYILGLLNGINLLYSLIPYLNRIPYETGSIKLLSSIVFFVLLYYLLRKSYDVQELKPTQ